MADKQYKLTFELSDGTEKSVEFTSPQGEPGKSAYQYAVDGGYTGTEEEFAAKLASENSGGSSVQSDWNAKEGEPGHVLNRTHYETVIMEPLSFSVEEGFSESHDLTGLLSDESFIIHKVTDEVFSKEQLDGAQMYANTSVVYGQGDVEYNDEASQLYPGIVDIYNYWTSSESTDIELDYGMILVVHNDIDPGIGTITKGTYISSKTIANGYHTLLWWTIENKNIKKLDAAYIPADHHIHYFRDDCGASSIKLIIGSVSHVFPISSKLHDHINDFNPVVFSFDIYDSDDSYVYSGEVFVTFPVCSSTGERKEIFQIQTDNGLLSVCFEIGGSVYTSNQLHITVNKVTTSDSIQIKKAVFTDRPTLWTWLLSNYQKVLNTKIAMQGNPPGDFLITPSYKDGEITYFNFTNIRGSNSAVFSSITMNTAILGSDGCGVILEYGMSFTLPEADGGEIERIESKNGTMTEIADTLWEPLAVTVTIYYCSE